MRLPIRRSTTRVAVATATLLVALAVRAWVFQVHAVGWDPNEYCWVAKRAWLPHGPYLLHAVTGWLVASVVDAEWGLSAVSLVSNLVAAWFLNRLLILQSPDPPSRRVAVATYLLLPVSSYQAGMQEVYAFQGAWTLAALVTMFHGRRWSPWLSGALFGLACLAHDGSLFLVPGFLVMAWYHVWSSRGQPDGGAPKREDTRQRAMLSVVALRRVLLYWLSWGVGALLVAMTGVGILWYRYRLLFPGHAWVMTLAQLRGISPIPGHARPETALSASLYRVGEHLSSPFALGWSLWAMLILLVLGLTWTRNRQRLLAWATWALPYLGYEIAVAGSPDVGAYLVYVLPFAAVMAGEAFGGAWRAVSKLESSQRERARYGRLLRGLLVMSMSATLLVPGARPLLTSDPWWRQGHIDTDDETLHWIERMTPSNTLVVGVGNGTEAISVGCKAGREVAQTHPLGMKGSHEVSTGYWVLETPLPGSGIIAPFLIRLTPRAIEDMLEHGRLILSLSAEPFPKGRDSALSAALHARLRLTRYQPDGEEPSPPGILYQVTLDKPRTGGRTGSHSATSRP